MPKLTLTRANGTRVAFAAKSARRATGVLALRPRRRRGFRSAFRGKGKLAKLITKIIRGNEETKYVAETLLDNVNFNSGIGSSNPLVPNEWYRCIPLVVPYTTGGQQSSFIRQGKVVNPVSCKVHLRVGFDYRDDHQRDLTVVVYMISSKTQRAYLGGSGAQPFETRILDNGDGTNVRFAGTFLDAVKPIDKDGIRLLSKRTFRLHKGQGTTPSNAISTSMGPIVTKNLTFNVPMPKKLQYEETVQTPASYAPVFGIGYYYNDNTTPDLDLTAGCIQVWARTEMWFKDA